jgi:hypothetical protein
MPLCAYQAMRHAYESLRKDHAITFAPGEIETISQQRNTSVSLPGYWELSTQTSC